MVGETQKFCKHCGCQQPSSQHGDEQRLSFVRAAKIYLWFCEISIWLSALIIAFMILYSVKISGFSTTLSFYLILTLLTPVIFSLVRWTLIQKQFEKMTTPSVSQVIEPEERLFMPNAKEPVSVIEDETKRFDTDRIVRHQ